MDKIVWNGITFDSSDIVRSEAYNPVSLLNDALEIGTLTASLHIENPKIWDKLENFSRNDKVLHYQGDILRGTYYLDTVERTGKYTFDLSANTAVSFLAQSNHNGGIYTGQTVPEVVADIVNVPYKIQSAFNDMKLYGWLPIAPRRENLAQVLFAIGAALKIDMDGVLRIEGLWNGVASTIAENRIFTGDGVKYEKKVTKVTVVEHQYSPTQNEEELFDGATEDGDKIEFREPAYEIRGDGIPIKESSANYCIVGTGSGKVYGKTYVHNTREVSKEVTPDVVENVISVKDATLVTLTNSKSVATRLANYYLALQTVSNTIISGLESPGDVITIAHPFGGTATGCIKETSIQFGASSSASDTKILLDYYPPDIGGGLLTKKVILTGSGTFTPPAGVTSGRVVLIGGGNGGTPGKDGENVQFSVEDTQISVTESNHYTKAVPWAQGGNGGDPGQPGEGGKILQFEIDFSGPIAYSCGTGGEQEQPGTDTTFGDKTSANGASNSGGFLDESTQTVYGSIGIDGVKGGKGNGYNDDGTLETTETVVYNGITYSPGGNNTLKNFKSDGTYDEYWGNKTGSSSGSLGGGAAAGSNGGNGKDPGEITIRYNSIVVKSSPGGDGANAVTPETPSAYGQGGGGGNGGGGAGARGETYAEVNIIKNAAQTPSYNVTSGGDSVVGKGSPGGRGADGCIIIYFEGTSERTFLERVDKNGIKIVDRFDRRVIQ